MRRPIVIVLAALGTTLALGACKTDGQPQSDTGSKAAGSGGCRLVTADEAKTALGTGNEMKAPMLNTDLACIIYDTTGVNQVEVLVKEHATASEAEAAFRKAKSTFDWMKENGGDALDGALTNPIAGTTASHLHCSSSNASIDIVKGTKLLHVVMAFDNGNTGSMTCDKPTLLRLRALTEAAVGRV